MNEYSIVITTTGDKETAKTISKLLVEQKLAACVQMFPIESIYFWEDKVNEDNEIVLFIKSRTELFGKIQELVLKNHPYKLPEIIQIPITDGLQDYLRWIGEYTK